MKEIILGNIGQGMEKAVGPLEDFAVFWAARMLATQLAVFRPDLVPDFLKNAGKEEGVLGRINFKAAEILAGIFNP